jgi:hypothetical protein
MNDASASEVIVGEIPDKPARRLLAPGIGQWIAFYNRASEHPSGYVVEAKRFC